MNPRVDVWVAAEVPDCGWAFNLPHVPDAISADVHVALISERQFDEPRSNAVIVVSVLIPIGVLIAVDQRIHENLVTSGFCKSLHGGNILLEAKREVTLPDGRKNCGSGSTGIDCR